MGSGLISAFRSPVGAIYESRHFKFDLKAATFHATLYSEKKPTVYIEPTVVSHLVARASADVTLASWQRATRRLWEDYADRFEFVISRLVRAEVGRGDSTAAQRRLEVIAHLTVLETS